MKKLIGFVIYILLLSMFLPFIPRICSQKPPVEFSPLQEIINNAEEGATIYVRGGIYYGVMKINKTLTLVGYDTILDANGSHVGIIVSASNVRLEGFKIQNAVRFGDGSIPEELSELWLDPEMEGAAIYIYWANNVVISDVVISDCYAGMGFTYSYNVKISGSSIAKTVWGMMLFCSGIEIFDSKISNGLKEYIPPDGRRLTGNGGIDVHYYSAINLTYSTISNTLCALSICTSGNEIHYNNFINNTHQVYIRPGMGQVADWYMNYWSDYTGKDLNFDNIGDTPYIIDEYNKDPSPLMKDPSALTDPHYLIGDINKDGKVDIRDVAIVAKAFGSYPGFPNWNPVADLNGDGKVDIRDVSIVAKQFGKI